MRARRFLLSPIAVLSVSVFVPALLQGHRAGKMEVRQPVSRAVASQTVARRTVDASATPPVSVVAVEASVAPVEVEAVAGSTLRVMEQRLGMTLRRRGLTVEVYATGEVYRRAGGLENTDACFLAPRRILIKGHRALKGDLAHEFAHVLISQHTRNRCPGWLEEGIINHENRTTRTGQYSPQTIAELEGYVRDMARSGRSWSLDGLSRDAQRARHMDDMFYGAAWSATSYLYRTYGRDSVLAATRMMADRPADAAFRSTFGKSLHQIEMEWRATL